MPSLIVGFFKKTKPCAMISYQINVNLIQLNVVATKEPICGWSREQLQCIL